MTDGFWAEINQRDRLTNRLAWIIIAPCFGAVLICLAIAIAGAIGAFD